MFSSPAPQARRRQGSRQPVSVSASMRSTPVQVSPPRESVEPTARPYYSSVAPSQEGMDLDFDDAIPGHNRVLLRDDDYQVILAGHLPLELRDILQKTNLESELFQGALDGQTGYGYLLSVHHCFVWNYTSPSSSQAAYEFPLPTTQSASLPYAAIVPHNSREPGLLVCSAEGEARYWDSVARALTSSQKFSRVVVPLEEGEKINGTWKWDPAVYLITTTYSRIYRITLTTTHAGLQLLLSSPFTRQRGMLQRVTSTFFGPGSPLSNEDDHTIVGLAVSHDGDNGKDVWVAKPESVEQWRVDRDGGEQLILEQPLQELLAEAITARSQLGDVHDIKLLDIAVLREAPAVVLFAFVRPPAVNPLSPAPSKAYSYALAKLQFSGGGVKPAFVREIACPTKDARKRVMARLAVPPGDTVAFVQFSDTVILTTLLEGSLLQEMVPLRNAVQNRYLGFGVHATEFVGVTFITARSGLLAFEVNEDHLKRQAAALLQSGNQDQAATARLKDRIEHAVFYGVSQDNPLSFDFVGESLQGNLTAAVEEISAGLMSSSSKYIRETIDMRQQLYDRLMRIETLTDFINRNGLRKHLSKESNWILCSDAERICAALELWNLHSSLLHQGRASASGTMVAQAIESCMQRSHEPLTEDNVRHFLKTKLRALGCVVDELEDIVGRVSSSRDPLDKAIGISTANRIVEAVFSTALDYRRTHGGSHDIERDSTGLTPFLWTSNRNQAKVLLYLIESTEKSHQELGKIMVHGLQRGATREQVDNLRTQLRAELKVLANLYFSTVRELQQTSIENSGQREMVDRTKDVYTHVRSDIIRSLVKVGESEEAIQLAEQEKDWRTLVILSNDASVGHPARIEEYLHRHGQDFAFPLYQWYIETGKLYQLLTPHPGDGELLDNFFAQHDYPRLAWIQHLSRNSPDLAARSLVVAASEEVRADEKMTMLSIAKLCDLATLRYSDLQSEGLQGKLEVYDSAIEVVTAQARLRDNLIDLVASSRTSSVDALVDAITPLVTRRLRSLALIQLFKRLSKRLFEGRVLSSEDLIDMETLMDNTRTPANYSIALKLYSRTEMDFPSARAVTTLQTLWRRVFLYDDWASITLNDRTDDDTLKARLRDTALYRTLRTASEERIPQQYWLRPSQCLQPAPLAEYLAHWPDYTVPQLEELQAAHAEEIERLVQLISTESGVGLERWYDEVEQEMRHRISMEARPEVEENMQGVGVL